MTFGTVTCRFVRIFTVGKDSLLYSQSIRILFCQDEPVNDISSTDLPFLMALIELGKLTPVIDKVHPLAHFSEAMQYINEGHTTGKVVIAVGE